MNNATINERPSTDCQDSWHRLPPRMRVLYVTGKMRGGHRLAESLVSESAQDLLLEEASGAAAGMSRLHDEAFDVVLASHEPEGLDALGLVAGLRAGGSDEPIVVLGAAAESEMLSQCYQAGADAYLAVSATTAQVLVSTIARAVERVALVRENRRLVEAERQRVCQERQEADRLLDQQRALLGELEASETIAGNAATPAGCGLPRSLVDHYRELLRTYVIMGTGNLTVELGALAELLASAGVSARQTMAMHLAVLEELVGTLGSRSARHVIARADLLVLELMVHLAEGYHRQSTRSIVPPRQRSLPGFGPAARGRAA